MNPMIWEDVSNAITSSASDAAKIKRGYRTSTHVEFDTGSREVQLLCTMLGLPRGPAGKLGFEATLEVDDLEKHQAKVFITHTGNICGEPLEGQFGVLFNPKPALFIGGKMKPKIYGNQYTFDITTQFGPSGAVVTGTMTGSVTVPVIELSLTNPALMFGVSWAGTPTAFGLAGELALARLETSFAMLFDSVDSTKCMLAASVSELSLKTIVESIAHLSVPGEIAPLLDIAKLTGYDAPFSIDAKLAADLDANKLEQVSAAFGSKASIRLPADSADVLLIVRKAGKRWSITDFSDKMNHYRLEMADDRASIAVTRDPQIYFVMKPTEIGGNKKESGFRVRGGVNLLGLKGKALVELERPQPIAPVQSIKVDAELDRIVVGNEKVFSVTAADGSPGPGPRLSFATPAGPGLRLQWPDLGHPHFEFNGKVTLLGVSAESKINVGLRDCSFALSASATALKVDLSGSFSPKLDFRDSGLDAGGSAGIDVAPVTVLGHSYSIGKISAGLAISYHGKLNAHLESTTFNFLGASLAIPGFDISVDDSLLDLPKRAGEQVADAIKDYLNPFKELAKLAGEVGKEMKNFLDNVGNAVSIGGGGFTVSVGGFSVGSDTFGFGGSSHPVLARCDADWVRALSTLRYPAWKMAAMLQQQLGKSASEVIGPLVNGGCPFDEIIDALLIVFKLPASNTAALLRQHGYSVNDAAGALRRHYRLGYAAENFALHQAGYRKANAELPSPNITTYNIEIAAGVSSGTLLGTTADGGRVYLVDRDDGSWRQRWSFMPRSGGYNIVPRGPNLHWWILGRLDDRNIDISAADDTSGRQQWKLTSLENGAFTIEADGGVSKPMYLSASSDGGRVDLWHEDDKSGRQHWRLRPDAALPPYNGDRPYHIKVGGGVSSGTLLSCNSDGSLVDLFDEDDGSLRQRWSFTRVTPGVYNIAPRGPNLGGRFLSCRADGHVDLFARDDGSGRQQWRLTSTGDGLFTIEPAAGMAQRMLLSATGDGGVKVASDDGSRRQQWTIAAY